MTVPFHDEPRGVMSIASRMDPLSLLVKRMDRMRRLRNVTEQIKNEAPGTKYSKK